MHCVMTSVIREMTSTTGAILRRDRITARHLKTQITITSAVKKTVHVESMVKTTTGAG